MERIIIFIMLFSIYNKCFAKTEQELIDAYSYTTNQIEVAIKILNPKIKDDYKKQLAKYIFHSGNQFNIDYRLFILILKVESNFNQKAISPTGDYSIAQIYYEYWSKDKRKSKLVKTKHLLDKIKENEFFAIMVMGEILSLAKVDMNKDWTWFAHYHSRTPKFKEKYLSSIRNEYKKIAHLDISRFLSFNYLNQRKLL